MLRLNFVLIKSRLWNLVISKHGNRALYWQHAFRSIDLYGFRSLCCWSRVAGGQDGRREVSWEGRHVGLALVADRACRDSRVCSGLSYRNSFIRHCRNDCTQSYWLREVPFGSQDDRRSDASFNLQVGLGDLRDGHSLNHLRFCYLAEGFNSFWL